MNNEVGRTSTAPAQPGRARTPLRAAPRVSASPSAKVSVSACQNFSISPAPLPPFLTRRELAAVLQISVRTIDRMLAGDEIPCRRIRNRVRFDLADVLSALKPRQPHPLW